MMRAEDIARALGARRHGRAPNWSARCPAHDDRNPSLSISIGDDGRTLLYCHAGCSFLSIIDALRRRGVPDDASSATTHGPEDAR